jgi:hypothetical protein
MTENEVKTALDRVLTWSRQRQEDVVKLLELIEEHDNSPYRLTDEQVAEVRRRMADTSGPSVTLDEMDERLRRLGL